jgi:hypothetical protein
LEDRTNATGHELRSRVDALFPVLDEDWYLPCAGRLEDLGQLSDGLLKNLWWANVDFGDDDHDGYIEGKCNAEMLSLGC